MFILEDLKGIARLMLPFLFTEKKDKPRRKKKNGKKQQNGNNGQNDQADIIVPPSANIGPLLFFGGITSGIVATFVVFLVLNLTVALFAALAIVGLGILCFHNVPALYREAIVFCGTLPVGSERLKWYVHLANGPTFLIPGLFSTVAFPEEERFLDIRYAKEESVDLPGDVINRTSVFKTASLVAYCADLRNLVLIREMQMRFRVLNPFLALKITDALRALYGVTISCLGQEIRKRDLDSCLRAKVDIGDTLKKALDRESTKWGIDITGLILADPGQLPETEAARQLTKEAEEIRLNRPDDISGEEAYHLALVNRGKATYTKQETVHDVGGRLGDAIEGMGPAIAGMFRPKG